MKNKKGIHWIRFIIFIIVALLIWGFIGGQQAQNIGVTCDIGVGDNLCWQWHKNIIGQADEFLKNTGNSIINFFE